MRDIPVHNPKTNRLDYRYLNPLRIEDQVKYGGLTADEQLEFTPLGTGVSGSVYKAADKKMVRIVAIKCSHQEIMAMADFQTMLETEVENQVLAATESAHLPTIYDYDPIHGRIYMQYIEGSHPDFPIKGRTPRRKFLIQVLNGLIDLHRHDCYHGDLKPNNILIEESGHVFLVDFGNYKVLGSHPTCAPEQKSRDNSQYSDMYNFGVIWFLALHNVKFGSFQTPGEIRDQILKTPGTPKFLKKCLEIDPTRRPTAAEVKDYFEKDPLKVFYIASSFLIIILLIYIAIRLQTPTIGSLKWLESELTRQHRLSLEELSEYTYKIDSLGLDNENTRIAHGAAVILGSPNIRFPSASQVIDKNWLFYVNHPGKEIFLLENGIFLETGLPAFDNKVFVSTIKTPNQMSLKCVSTNNLEASEIVLGAQSNYYHPPPSILSFICFKGPEVRALVEYDLIEVSSEFSGYRVFGLKPLSRTLPWDEFIPRSLTFHPLPHPKILLVDDFEIKGRFTIVEALERFGARQQITIEYTPTPFEHGINVFDCNSTSMFLKRLSEITQLTPNFEIQFENYLVMRLL